MSDIAFARLGDCVTHLPKSEILAGNSIPYGRYPFYLSGEKIGRINESISNQDAIVMGDGGTASIFYAKGKYSYSSHNFAFHSNCQELDTNYLFRAIEFFLPYIDYKGFVGSGIKNIDKKFFFDLFIEIPPLSDQKKISNILTSFSETIENIKNLIHKLQDLKSALIKNLLTKGIRFHFCQNVMDENQNFYKNWKSTKIDDIILDISDGGTPNTTNSEYFGGDIPWIIIDDIKPRIYKTKTSITKLGLSKSSAKIWDSGTIILSTGATIGKVGIAMNPMATKQGICGIVPKQNVDTIYLYYYFISIRNQLNILSQGSTIKETRVPTIKEIHLQLPSLLEQRKIATILTSLDHHIDNFSKKLNKIESLKKSLMKCLLKDKIRIKNS